MYLGVNKTPVKIIKEGAFGGTYFGDIYSSVNERWYRNNLISWKILIRSIIVQIIKDIGVNKYGVKCGTSLRFWGNKGWINGIDPYRWFQ